MIKNRFILKLLSSLIVCILVFSLCGCKGENTEEESKNYKVIIEEKTEKTEAKKVSDLTKDKKSDYQIVYSTDAGEAVIQGAKEIQNFLLESSSAYAKITDDEGFVYDKNTKVISLGNTKALKGSGLNIDYSLLKNDGFFMKTKDNSVFIDGISDRGILYGAYDFCEKVIGVKYLTYDYTYVPDNDNIELYEMDITDNPVFNDRCFLYTKIFNSYQFTSRMRMISEYTNMPDMYGGDLGWFNDTNYVSNYVHNTLCYVDPEVYYKSHPEWFYVTDKTVNDLCYSHVGLNADGTVNESLKESPVKVAIEQLKDVLLHSDESVKYYMIGQMDVNHACQCKDCLAQEEKYGRSGMNIRFINAIYDNVSKWAKEQGITKEWYLCTFAYQWSQSAPVKLENGKFVPLDDTVIPKDDVIVRLAPIQADNYRGMIDEKQNERTRNMFLGWFEVLKGKKVMIWSYHSRYSFYFCYYPTMHHWQEDLNLYQEMGAQYILMQPDFSETHDWKIAMETYIASKMLWNLNLDANQLRDEFIHYYYKELEDLVKEYNLNFEVQFANITSREDAPDMTVQGLDEILEPKYYSTAFWETQLNLIDKMYEKVKGLTLTESERANYNMKVDELKLTSQFMLLYNYDRYYFDDYWGKQAMLKDFFDTCTSLQIRNWRETNGTLTTLKSKLGYLE